jgi:tripartite-type tricarboxylate transporter receptor subunit TctC
MTRIYSRLLTIVGVVLALTATAAAQEFPTKPVRIIVPFAPGGINDIVGRMVATHLTERFGRQVIVENRPGAGAVVGTELVANSPKDGHTLLVVSIAHAVNPWLYKLNYDPSKSFVPIAPVLSSQNALAVNLDLPAKSLKEFIALAKQQPGKIQYASGGVGGSLHLAMELFKITAGIDLLHVPFRGAGPAIIDVIGGHASGQRHHLDARRTSAAASCARSASAAEAQCGHAGRSDHQEGGVPGYDAGNWIGIAAPAGTPAPIVATLHKEITAMLDQPAIQKQIAADGSEIMRMSPSEFATYMDNEMAKWGKVVKQAGIKAQ